MYSVIELSLLLEYAIIYLIERKVLLPTSHLIKKDAYIRNTVFQNTL